MNDRQLVGSGELLSKSYAVFTANLWTNLVFGLLMVLPFTIISWIMSSYATVALVWGLIAGSFLALLVSSVATITLISYTHQRIIGQDVGMFFIFLNSFDILFSFLWLGLLMSLWVLGGLLLLIIPGIIIAIRFSLASYILIVEGRRGLNALMRSRDLVHGYTFTTLVRWLAPYLPLIAFLLVGYAVPQYEQYAPKTYEVMYTMLNVLTSPFLVIYGYFLYKDLASIDLASTPS